MKYDDSIHRLLLNILYLTTLFQRRWNHVSIINCEEQEAWKQLVMVCIRQCYKTNPQRNKRGSVGVNLTLRHFRERIVDVEKQ